MRATWRLLAPLAALLLGACLGAGEVYVPVAPGPDDDDDPGPVDPGPIDPGPGPGPPIPSFSTEIIPIFQANCAFSGCHGATFFQQNQQLTPEAAFANIVNVPSMEVPTLDRIEPGDPERSYMIQKLRGIAAVGERMPLGAPPLSEADLRLLTDWITGGAPNN